MSKKVSAPTWPRRRLREVAEVVKGKTPSNFVVSVSDKALPYLEAAFLRRQSKPQYISLKDTNGLVLTDDTDTLILWDGANAGDIFRGQTGVVASTMARVRVTTDQLLPDFLFFCIALDSARLRDTAAGSTVPHVRGMVVYDLPIPLPLIPVQERIVQILLKAEGIQRKRMDAQELAEAILPASFISMFNDPINNRNCYDIKPLGQLSDVRSGATKGRRFGGQSTVEVPYLRVANVQDGYLDLDEIKTIEVLPDDIDRFHLEDGDILMTEGGDPDKLGRGCIWRNQIRGCIHQNHIFRVRVDRGHLIPEYLAALLRTQYAKAYFLSCAKRSSNLASVNATQVKAFPVPVPPIELQNKFVTAGDQWDQAIERLAGAHKESTRMFRNLISQAFSGALTFEWESANAEEIAAKTALHERLPRLLLLALLKQKVQRGSRRAPEAAVMVTALMKYAFLFQMEGASRRRFYHFVPYHYGPFAKEVYGDLKQLQAEGLVDVDREADKDKTRITLTDTAKADAALAELPTDMREDIVAVLDAYGEMGFNALLKAVYKKYPAYAKNSRLRKGSSAK